MVTANRDRIFDAVLIGVASLIGLFVLFAISRGFEFMDFANGRLKAFAIGGFISSFLTFLLYFKTKWRCFQLSVISMLLLTFIGASSQAIQSDETRLFIGLGFGCLLIGSTFLSFAHHTLARPGSCKAN